MAINASIEGRITYAADADFAAAVAELRKGPWLDAAGVFVDEGRDVVEPGVGVDAATRTVTIPWAIYRDLIRLVGPETPLFTGGVGRVLWTCTDGMATAGVFAVAADGSVADDEVDLEEWGAAHLNEAMPDEQDDPDEYADWTAVAEFRWVEENR